MNVAVGIEKNRIRLLRIVFCWLALAGHLSAHGDRPLPLRLARYISGLFLKAEKATAYLLITAFYCSQTNRRFSPAFEKAAMNFAVSNGRIALGVLTVQGAIKRLKSLQHMLHNLHLMARRLAKSVAARARVSAMASAAKNQDKIMPSIAPSRENAVPP